MYVAQLRVHFIPSLMCQEEINRQVEARKKTSATAQRSTVFQIAQLISSRELAVRRHDIDGAESINRQLVELGADPSTGQITTTNSDEMATNVSDYDSMIQKINDNNKRKTKEAMQAAHTATLQRKKAEEAILKAKQSV